MSVLKPKLSELTRELDQLSKENVIKLAIQLELKYSDLLEMSSATALWKAMEMWLDDDVEASWEKLVDSLKDIKQNRLAKKLEEKFCSSIAKEKQRFDKAGISSTNHCSVSACVYIMF